jgi:HEAT repeat protein
MVVQLLPQTQELIEILLNENDDKARYEALAKVSEAQDKDQLEKYVLEWLDEGDRDDWSRTWSLTVLARLGLPNGVERVIKHLVNPPEQYPWTRHFALINAGSFEPFPLKAIEKAAQDEDVLPRATALRLLVANGVVKYEKELLDMLRDEHNPDARWAAARALRNRSDLNMKPLRAQVEKRFIPMLIDIAGDPNIYLDTRWECIQTLASFLQQKFVAAPLAELLMKDPNSTMRRYYLEALIKLNQPDESKAALLKAVEDSDAQIRLEAANALESMIGAEESVKTLIPRALQAEKNIDLLVDGLRHISSDLAATGLRDALGNPDTKVSSRANDLLTMLGGQTAAQILIGERTKALDRYTSILTGADEDVRKHFGQLISQARAAFWFSMAMHTIVFLIGVGILIGSLVLAFQDGLNTVTALVGGTVGTVAVVLTTFYRNPLRNVRGSLNALMQVDVVFLGYVRQINQIDATFKHMFLEARDFGTTQMQATVAESQSAVSKILEEIQKHIEDKSE